MKQPSGGGGLGRINNQFLITGFSISSGYLLPVAIK
jgi:hypothetical protein